MVQKQNKDIPTLHEEVNPLLQYIRLFDLSLPSLFTEAIKMLHKIINVARFLLNVFQWHLSSNVTQWIIYIISSGH